MEVRSRGRARVFLRAQLPFILGVLFLVGISALAEPATLTAGPILVGLQVSVLATAAALLVPWQRLPRAWMMTIAGLDLLTVALLRAELLPLIPAVSILAVFPVLWLAYGFPWYGIAVAVLGAGFITSFQFAYVGKWPSSSLEWANVVTLPTFIVGVAVIVFVAARHRRRNSRRLVQAHGAQAAALAEARDTEAVALGIVDTVIAGVAYYDARGHLAIGNARAHGFAQLGGFRLDEPPHAGDEVLDADRAGAIPYDAQIIPRALAGDTDNDQLEWWGPTEARVAILGSASRVRRPDGGVLGTVIVIYDVTELAESIEVREQFLRTVSHELRTPLTSITGFLELIDDAIDPADATLRRYVDVVTRRTDDLARRVSDLFAASEGVKTLHCRVVEVNEVVTAAIRRVQPLAEAGGHRIERLGAHPLRAFVDRAQLVVALTELLTNAVKFGAPSAPITVSHRLDGDRLRIEVANSGPGITPAEQRRAFDRFYRTPLARSLEIQGFGLGLSTVRAIATAHAGTVHIDSVPGERTVFALDLSARTPEAFTGSPKALPAP